MKDLSPTIYRQRLIIEGKTKNAINDFLIKKYLKELSFILKMKILQEPITHKSEKFGWAGWIHWEESGAHFYVWEKPFPFFSCDIYTCKGFKTENAVVFTRNFFKCTEIVFKKV